jgi:hypothetical protein
MNFCVIALIFRSDVSKTQVDASCERVSKPQEVVSCGNLQPVGSQANGQTEKSNHPSWKTMSTLGAETEVSEEQVLIEVEQFDPIARKVLWENVMTIEMICYLHKIKIQNVWIPGVVLHNTRKGKFKAILTDKYGDKVILFPYYYVSIDSITDNFFKQWEDTFDIDQYGTTIISSPSLYWLPV